MREAPTAKASGCSRRQFLRRASAGTLGLLLGPSVLSRSSQASAAGKPDAPFLAIQTHAHDYFLEGAETVCRNVVERGGFNQMLFAATYVREGKWTNHQPGNDYTVEAGLYFAPDPKLYRDSGVAPRRAPSAGMESYNALAEVSKAARKVGVGAYAWISDYDQRLVAADYPELRVVGPDGKPADSEWFCPNNPRARAYVVALYEDVARNYDVDGFFMDRIRYSSPTAVCYCKWCREAMERSGLDAERVMSTMRRIAGQPAGTMTLMIGASFDNIFENDDVVEVAQWMRFRQQTVADHVAQVRRLVADLRPEWKVGLDLIGPIGAPSMGQDYSTLAAHCEWLKPMLYHHSTARGVRQWVEGMAQMRGMTPDKAYDQARALFLLQGTEMPQTWDEFREAGMPASWVSAQTKYCQGVVGDKAEVYPGIQGWEPATTDEIRAMLNAAFDAGAPGITTYCYSNMVWEKFDVFREVFKERFG
ncbi:MAG: twin-arginine translocation signal domain-containing protein [Armatimonadota bacterium]|nr:MAG: twin-arginine translocation signal domain-containing protein [Armatimonadota bacterium]